MEFVTDIYHNVSEHMSSLMHFSVLELSFSFFFFFNNLDLNN